MTQFQGAGLFCTFLALTIVHRVLSVPVDYPGDVVEELHQDLVNRENACMALNNCGGAEPPSSSFRTSITSASLQTSSTAASVTSSTISKYPAATASVQANLTTAGWRGTYQCNAADGKTVQRAYEDASKLANEAYKWVPGGRWDATGKLYLGDDCGLKENRGIKARFTNAFYDIYYASSGNWIFPQAYFYNYCHEKDGKNPYSPTMKNCKAEPYAYAYSFTITHWYWPWHDAYYTVFCDPFWKQQRDLSEVLADAKISKIDKNNADAIANNRARSVLHELTHHSPAITRPQAGDLKYGAYWAQRYASVHGCNKLKQDTRSKSTSVFADNYAIFANTVWFQNELSLQKPPSGYDPVSYSNDDISVAIPVFPANGSDLAPASMAPSGLETPEPPTTIGKVTRLPAPSGISDLPAPSILVPPPPSA